MWRDPEYTSIKQENRQRINDGQEPGSLLDVLSIVEHPAFQSFYDELIQEGLASTTGDDSDGNDVDDPTRLPITGTASLALTKRLAAGSAPSYVAAGDVVAFEFVVRNTGTLTLPAPVTVADPI